MSVTGSRRAVHPGRTTTVVSYSSIEHRPPAGDLADRRARERHRQVAERRSRAWPWPARTAVLERQAVDRVRRPERREPERADLDRRAGLAAHAVEPLVLVLERLDRARARSRRVADARPRPPTSGRRSGAPRSAATRPRRGRRASSRPELVEDPRRARAARRRARRGGTARTSWNSGRAKSRPSDAEEPRERGHEHGAAAEVLGEPGGVHRAGAAVGDQREVARVAALLGRDRPQRAHHPRVRDRVDPGGEPRARQRRAARRARSSAPAAGELGRDVDLAVRDGARRHQAEHDVGVGHGRLVAAAAVAGRPGSSARAARSDLQARPPRRARRSSRRPRRPRRCRSSGSAAARRRRASAGCRPKASRRPRTRGRARRRRPRSATPSPSCRPCRTRSRSR